jgi:hypothetical protein
MRKYGIEPIVQVPVDDDLTLTDNENNAYDLVDYLNNTQTATPDVTYWCIGNEPNDNGNYDNWFSATDIAIYIRGISDKMKSVSGQSGIKIIGPSLTFYDYSTYHDLMTPASGNSIMGSGSHGYYIDYISFNTYPFQNECYWTTSTNDCSGSTTTPITKTDVVNNIEASGKFHDVLKDIKNYRTTAGRTTSLGIIVTEANISYEQNTGDRGPSSIGPGGFLAGQYWAEMMAAALEEGISSMCFWSVIEGGSGDSYLTDLGYVETEGGYKRSTFWHYYMMGNFMRNGTLYMATNNTSGLKAFATKTTGGGSSTVMVMNQTGSSVNYYLSLNTDATVSGGIEFDGIGIDNDETYQYTIPANATQWLIINGCGDRCRVYEYTQADYISDPNLAHPYITELDRSCLTCPVHRSCLEPDTEDPRIISDETIFEDKTPFSDDTLWINGTVTIAKDASLELYNMEVQMGSESEIVVEPGGQLIISNSSVHACDGAVWDGITATGDLTTPEQIIIEGSTLEDAYIILRAESLFRTQIIGNTFRNSIKCISIENSKVFRIEENIFDSIPYPISTLGCSPQSGTSYTFTLTDNYFDNPQIGFYSESNDFSELDIECNTFNNYMDYAIYTSTTVLKDQGTSGTGAGNRFTSLSPYDADEILYQNDVNPITYYSGPSYPLSMDLSITNITESSATYDATCFSYRPSPQQPSQAEINKKYPTNFILYPNPAFSTVTLAFALNENQKGFWKLINLMGQEIASISINANSHSALMDISKLTPGIYLSSVIIDGAQVKTTRLAVSK